MELIDKDTLVAEIKKRLNKYSKLYSFNYGAVKDLEYLLNFINTLEVKEVDLEEIIEQTYHDSSVTDTADIDHVTYENIAKHFFELGMQQSNNDNNNEEKS